MSRHRPSSGPWEHMPTKRLRMNPLRNSWNRHNVQRSETPIPLVIALACLIVLLVFTVANKAFGQAAYDQINAGQYTCKSC